MRLCWHGFYPKESGGFTFDSLMLSEEERAKAIASKKIAEAEAPRLLAVDNEAVVPVGKIVRVQVTASDVIHKFTVPSFGIKIDAIPGRLNETWFKAEREGIYYGQCSFICGQNHAFMLIAGFIVLGAALYVEIAYEPPIWLHMPHDRQDQRLRFYGVPEAVNGDSRLI